MTSDVPVCALADVLAAQLAHCNILASTRCGATSPSGRRGAFVWSQRRSQGQLCCRSFWGGVSRWNRDKLLTVFSSSQARSAAQPRGSSRSHRSSTPAAVRARKCPRPAHRWNKPCYWMIKKEKRASARASTPWTAARPPGEPKIHPRTSLYEELVFYVRSTAARTSRTSSPGWI